MDPDPIQAKGLRFSRWGAPCLLAPQVNNNQTIVIMNLANNTFESAGAKALAEWVGMNHSLVELNLGVLCHASFICGLHNRSSTGACEALVPHSAHSAGSGMFKWRTGDVL